MSLTQEQVREDVREYLRTSLSIDVVDGEDIFKAGFVNSLFAVQLVAFVEKRFHISVEDEDMELNHFRSVDALTAFVVRKTSALVVD